MNKETRNLQYYLNRAINKRNLDDNDYKKIYGLLQRYKSFEDHNNGFYYINMAKLNFLRKDFDAAENNIYFIKEGENGYISSKYLLFKINIAKNNIKKAKLYLLEYQLLKEEKNMPTNISVYYYLIDILNENKPSNILVNDNINGIKIEEDTFKDLWNLFIKFLLNKDYKSAFLALEECQKYVVEHNIYLDFKELQILLDRIIKKANLKARKVPPLDIMKEANKLIEEDNLKEAEILLTSLKSNFEFKKYKKQYSYLLSKYNEKKWLNDILNSELKDIYEQCKSLGKLNMYYNDFYTAYQYFMAGAYLTDLPYFYYKAGQAMFLYGNEKEAADLFLKYNETGFSKLKNSFSYLSQCRSLFNSKERRFYKGKLWQINALKRDVKIADSQENVGNVKDNIFEETSYDREDIDINEILTNFDSYTNLEKIKAIRILYQNGFRKYADNYYKMYSKLLESDKESTKEFKRLALNRKLYINQGKSFQS